MEVTSSTRRTLSIAAFALMAMAVASSLEPVAANKDGDVLAALHKGLEDPDGNLKSWDPSLVNPCTWFYVTCDGDNSVTRLDLGNLNLAGTLAPELGQLEKLVSLDLSSNSISGAIPAALGNAKSLTFLDFSNNDLCGTIPTDGAFQKIPASSFANNPRLHQGGEYEPSC
ncbi:hypothetical protein BDA96_09G189000 [Sorghum bicolor]|uniref:Leucine-rich repeat-containing N-terminal plant-type domain-containing protein n=1 Tax=Sorghum bicolor TaxID=4558 RepID=A0A921U4L9_SORBI|nr:hypothetical protein BDA96_09G189000 [Sorghum bicolor]